MHQRSIVSHEVGSSCPSRHVWSLANPSTSQCLKRYPTQTAHKHYYTRSSNASKCNNNSLTIEKYGYQVKFLQCPFTSSYPNQTPVMATQRAPRLVPITTWLPISLVIARPSVEIANKPSRKLERPKSRNSCTKHGPYSPYALGKLKSFV